MTLPNLNHLKYFADAVELGSISASAQKNLVTHPAVSRAIGVMESQLGVKLLVHKKKIFEVTPAGLLIAQKAKALLAAAVSYNVDGILKTASVAGVVSLGVSRTIGLAYLNPILKNLSKEYPEINLKIKFGTTNELVEKVAQDSISLALTIGRYPMATLNQTLLRRGQFTLVSSTHKSKALPKNLSLESFVLTEPRTETELLKKQFYQKFKAPLLVKHEVGSWDMIAHLVAEGIGIGLIPDIALPTNQKRETAIVRADWLDCPYEIYLNQSKTAERNSACRALVEVIKSEFR